MQDTTDYDMNQESNTPPDVTRNIEAEVCVIGSLILAGRDQPSLISEVLEMINDRDFADQRHAKIFKSLAETFLRDATIDIITVTSEMRDIGTLDDCGGVDYLIEIAESVPVAMNAVVYAKIVAETSSRRQILEACSKAKSQIMAGGVDAAIVGDSLNDKLARIHGRQGMPKIYSIGEAATSYLKSFEGKQAGESSAIPTGFNSVDTQIIGFVPGEMSIIAARPSHGKTAFTMNIADNMAARGIPTGLFSLEMNKEAVAMRALSATSGIDSYAIRRNLLELSDHQKLSVAQNELNNTPLYIDDQPKLPVSAIRSRAFKMVETFGVQVIFIDYLQIVARPKYAKSEYEAVTEISGDLKALAKELDVPVVVLSQLSRYEGMNEKNPPKLHHLRSSGSIEQDADIVMMLHIPSKYSSTYRCGEADLIVAKNRNGGTGDVLLGWHKETTRFKDRDVPLFDNNSYLGDPV